MNSANPTSAGTHVVKGEFVKPRSNSQGGPVRGTVVLANDLERVEVSG
jgi:hypothetical protein